MPCRYCECEYEADGELGLAECRDTLAAQLESWNRDHDESWEVSYMWRAQRDTLRDALLVCMTALGQYDPAKPLPIEVRRELLADGWRALKEASR